MACNRSLTIKKAYARMIQDGHKTIEVRPVTPRAEKISIGDCIHFHWYNHERLVCEVLAKTAYPTIRAMLDACDVKNVLPNLTLEKACAFQLQQ